MDIRYSYQLLLYIALVGLLYLSGERLGKGDARAGTEQPQLLREVRPGEPASHQIRRAGQPATLRLLVMPVQRREAHQSQRDLAAWRAGAVLPPPRRFPPPWHWPTP